MKKRVAIGLAAVIVSNTIVGTTNVASAMIGTTDRDTITQITEDNITGKDEIQSTVNSNEAEETVIQQDGTILHQDQSVSLDQSNWNHVTVTNVDEFKVALTKPQTVIDIVYDIEVYEPIEIRVDNIQINGNLNHIDIISNAASNNGVNTSSLAVKSKNVVINNVAIINRTTKPGLTLYGAKNACLTDIEIIGILFDEEANQTSDRSGVGIDIYNSTVTLENITCANSLYRDFQVRGGSTVELLSMNNHSADVVHMQTIQRPGEPANTIIDASQLYIAGVEFEENNEKKIDYYLKYEVDVGTLEELLHTIKYGGAVITLQNDIQVNPVDDANIEIEVGRNVTIDGDGNTLDLNGKGKFVLKGKDIVVRNLNVVNSADHGVNIYNSKNVLLQGVNVSQSVRNGIFVNGSTVVLRDFMTSSNGEDGIKITRSRTLNAPSHFDSEVKLEGSRHQEESTISVNVTNLEMVDGYKQDNKFIFVPGTYNEHVNDEEYKRLSQYYIDLLNLAGTPAETKEFWEQQIDYLVIQGRLDVTKQTTVTDASGNPIQLVADGVVDNTAHLIELIKYAASHSQELYFPAGTYKITSDIDLSQLNLPAASNFRLTGDPNGLSIIDGSNNPDKMLEIFNDEYHAPMNYVDIEHLVFNNVGIAINGPYKKGITLKNNVFMNGNYTREKRSDGSVQKATMEPYIEVKNSKYVIENNIFLRGAKYPGRGIATYRSKNTTIKDNFFGNLEGIHDAIQMVPNLANKLSLIQASNLTEGDQGNFFTAINNERYDTNVLIQNNYFNMVKTRNILSDLASDTLISGINVAADGQRRDHIIYAKGYDNLQIVGNYFKGQENGAAGGVKIRNGKNAYIGANYFDDVPLLTYIYPDLSKSETILYNTVIYNNLFHQKTNFGQQGTGILFYQSFRDGDNLTYSNGDTWDNAFGDVQDFVIYNNEFKSDERDRITITGRAVKAFNDNQFLAYDNKYKNTNTLVNYNTTGNFGLSESTLDVIQGKVANNTGFNLYKDKKIPLTPARVDYTYLKEIYDEAKAFLDEIRKNDLVGDTIGKYPTKLVEQLEQMMAEIETIYQEGKLLQAETNLSVTDLDELYEIVKNSRITGDNTGGSDNSGSGDNSGAGNGSIGGDNSSDGKDSVEGCSKTFIDIKGHWAQTEIEYVAQKCIFMGTSSNKFEPNSNMDRAMFVTILHRLSKEGNVADKAPFDDVTEGSYYEEAVNWAYKNSLIKGTTSTTFSPHTSITRQEMGVMFDNYLQYANVELPTENKPAFADENSISPWALESVRRLQRTSIMFGKGDNRFDPITTSTRAEVAVIIYRYMTQVNK